MSGRRRMSFILTSLLLWALLGATLWLLLGTLETSCKLQEARSGLWAECFAPAGQIFLSLFVVVLIVDLIRIASVLWAAKPEKE
ncbi:hypothetical protein [Novosphingobium sp.]|uniref:hypothetical protein n=1 Tax=Novosphingobium sp. TaxID=1874826 RepID=UPI001DAD22F4|nr:hypothetical protein [Novosphingobium sp.]MBX9661957.1 hypothetical protein [Novosphingobium sp.]